MSELLIDAKGLRKAYGDVVAVAGLDLEVAAGEVYGLLGPNGAGKTTTVAMLTTMIPPSGGKATVAGHDLDKQSTKIRAEIGYVPQTPISDKTLTGWENVIYSGRLYHLGRELHERCREALELVGLWDVRDRRVRKYSGGMRKRLDLACGLVHKPRLLFLDEPSLGLDVASRLALWEHVEGLRAGGTAVVLCTNQMEEAARLATRIGILLAGEKVAEGDHDTLVARVGGDLVRLVTDPAQAQPLADALGAMEGVELQRLAVESGELDLACEDGPSRIPAMATAAAEQGATLRRIDCRRPTLEEAFLAVTGKAYVADGYEESA